MDNKLLCVVMILIGLIIGLSVSYFLFYKKRFDDGFKKGKKFVLEDYVVYKTPEETIDMCQEFIDEDDHFPILLIRPDKYDYIDGRGEEIQKFYK